MLKWMLGSPVSVQRHRDFCGFGGNNCIWIVYEVRRIVQSRSASRAIMPAKEVYYVPTLRSVPELLGNLDTLKSDPDSRVCMDKFLQQFERENLF
jgi:hypothetical protein